NTINVSPHTSIFICHTNRPPQNLPSFPTRRSSDLRKHSQKDQLNTAEDNRNQRHDIQLLPVLRSGADLSDQAKDGKYHHNNARQDRKSTRLNSSHVSISYAVFCLKKKTKKNKSTEM